ncbi:bifunctional DNA primase/polymerase [Streptomyces sp. H10-C2]|uniref:bifunctional DNA primase/polymerase n=1 Tax=unclassified Streptomyces TaxID=2593676 RepID=UPI0024BA3C58|nr:MULTISPECIES: bifunctional DNA primase/polymerase [unclassified Streptomyces]MDJ0344274.1 bifunctional DNA primase/polymerase [Streptomyces sp. PH10-H1]MDJ0373612.1 bifunctional DNA primase/polymerase [Streptomyces sp. H10-C2]
MTTAAAVDLTARGLAVFPLPPGGRKPAGPWRSRCLTNPERVRELWRDGDNIGIGCRASGVIGLDLDLHDEADGLAVLAHLAARLGKPWPETLTAATPSGGRHMYFLAPDGCTIGSSSGGRTALGPGIDVRGPGRHTGGYLIGPGSVVGGNTYTVVHDVPVAPLPGWISARLPSLPDRSTR